MHSDEPGRTITTKYNNTIRHVRRYYYAIQTQRLLNFPQVSDVAGVTEGLLRKKETAVLTGWIFFSTPNSVKAQKG